jgi:hypothetical protein
MTREHLIEDIRNVIGMVEAVERGEEEAEPARLAVQGLHRHITAESDVPERVVHCLRESIRALDAVGPRPDAESWQYARTCLEAALEFAEAGSSLSV